MVGEGRKKRIQANVVLLYTKVLLCRASGWPMWPMQLQNTVSFDPTPPFPEALVARAAKWGQRAGWPVEMAECSPRLHIAQ